MPIEKEDYRLNLERLLDRFGRREAISLKEAAEYLSCDPRSLRKAERLPMRKLGRRVLIPLTGFARWLS